MHYNMKRIFCFVLLCVLTHCVWAQGSGDGYNPDNPSDPDAYYTLEVVASPTKAGTASPAKTMLAAGGSVSCSASANIGYTFKHWLEGDEVISTERYMYYTMPDHNVVLTAVFEFTGYDPENPGDPDQPVTMHYINLYANPKDAGYFSNSKLKLAEGESTMVRAYSKEGWSFESWLSDGEVVSTDNPMKVVMGDKSLSFTAQFKYDPTSPGDPSPNFFDPETGVLVIYSFDTGYLSSAVNATLGDYAYGDVRKAVIIGGMSSNDFNVFSNFVNCKIIDISSTTGYDRIPSYGFAELSALEEVFLPDGITEIGNSAFASCVSLNSLVIPESVTSIGRYAFSGCRSLTSINIPSGLTSIEESVFFGCSGFTSVVIPNGVTTIGASAFQLCTNLASISLPSSVTEIGYHAFNNCSSLTSLVIPESVTTVAAYAFYNCSSLASISIPAGVAIIGSSAFEGCSALVDITNLAETPQQIEEDVFSNYDATLHVKSGLRTAYQEAPVWSKFFRVIDDADGNPTPIELPDNFFYDGLYYNKVSETTVEVAPVPVDADRYSGDITIPERTVYEGIEAEVVGIGAMAFSNCLEVMSATLPESITYIGGWAFWDCGLTSMILPEGLTSIGECAFNGCSTLTSINIPSGVTRIESSTFLGCSSLTSLILPDDLTFIGEFAFQWCNNLASINIPSGVTSIREGTFWNCGSLASLTLPDGITSIGDEAFENCVSLASISIPSNVTHIGEYAFYDCTSLADITNFADIPQQITEDAFSNYDATLHVKHGLHTVYKETPVWQNFFKVIDDADGNPTPTESPDSFFCDGLYYNKVSELTVEVAPVPEGVEKYSGDIVIPERVVYEGVEAEVVGIGKSAFEDCVRLNSVSVPETVANIGSDAFSGCSNLVFMHWNANMVEVPVNLSANPNVIIYATEQYQGNAMRENLVKGDVAEKLVLHDGYNLCIPQPFWSKQATYVRDFTKLTQKGTAAGWETIVLPFDVANVVNETKGRVAPFGSEEATDKHFYLARLGDGGFELTSVMSANTPYIVCMPNNPAYDEQYNLNGKVMFYSKSTSGVYVSATDEAVEDNGPLFNLIPSYEKIQASPNFYMLNDDAYEGMLPGSVFVQNKDVEPFRAYAVDVTGYAPAYLPLFEGADAVMPIVNTASDNDVMVYDLMGQRQNPKALVPGRIYIINGVKTIYRK